MCANSLVAEADHNKKKADLMLWFYRFSLNYINSYKTVKYNCKYVIKDA